MLLLRNIIAKTKLASSTCRAALPIFVAIILALPAQFTHACTCVDTAKDISGQEQQLDCCCSLKKVVMKPACCETDTSCCKISNTEDCRCEQCPSKQPIEARLIELDAGKLTNLIVSLPRLQPIAADFGPSNHNLVSLAYSAWSGCWLPSHWHSQASSAETLLCVWRL